MNYTQPLYPAPRPPWDWRRFAWGCLMGASLIGSGLITGIALS